MRVSLWNLRGVALIVSAPTGVRYGNQTCGHACLQDELEGILVPWNNDPPLDSPELETERQLAEATLNTHSLSEAQADRVDAILASSSDTACARVDRSRLQESHEAWIHVRIDTARGQFPLLTGFGPCQGVLTWQNSD